MQYPAAIRRLLPRIVLGLGMLWTTVAAAQPAPATPVWSYLTDRDRGSMKVLILLGRLTARSSGGNHGTEILQSAFR